MASIPPARLFVAGKSASERRDSFHEQVAPTLTGNTDTLTLSTLSPPEGAEPDKSTGHKNTGLDTILPTFNPATNAQAQQFTTTCNFKTIKNVSDALHEANLTAGQWNTRTCDNWYALANALRHEEGESKDAYCTLAKRIFSTLTTKGESSQRKALSYLGMAKIENRKAEALPTKDPKIYQNAYTFCKRAIEEDPFNEKVKLWQVGFLAKHWRIIDISPPETLLKEAENLCQELIPQITDPKSKTRLYLALGRMYISPGTSLTNPKKALEYYTQANTLMETIDPTRTSKIAQAVIDGLSYVQKQLPEASKKAKDALI